MSSFSKGSKVLLTFGGNVIIKIDTMCLPVANQYMGSDLFYLLSQFLKSVAFSALTVTPSLNAG